MIRHNLSTRPFYNDRAVNLWLTALAVVAVLVTGVNVASVLRYSGSNTELVRQAAQDEDRAEELRKNAAALRASVDAKQIGEASEDARQANDLIDRRTFSWTELFNRFETTLPDNVRIRSVRPALDRDHRIGLTIAVLARGVDDVNAFMERLDATGLFQELRSIEEHLNDEEQVESVLQAVYLPGASAPAGQTAGQAAAPGAPAR